MEPRPLTLHLGDCIDMREHDVCACPCHRADASVLPLLTPEERTIRGVLIAHGVDSTENQGLHGWRCRYPENYGPCTCFDDLVADLEALPHKPRVTEANN